MIINQTLELINTLSMLYLLYVQPYSSQIINTQVSAKVAQQSAAQTPLAATPSAAPTPAPTPKIP